MSNHQIPTAVGRIDPIVDAVKQGDKSLALELLGEELQKADQQ